MTRKDAERVAYKAKEISLPFLLPELFNFRFHRSNLYFRTQLEKRPQLLCRRAYVPSCRNGGHMGGKKIINRRRAVARLAAFPSWDRHFEPAVPTNIREETEELERKTIMKLDTLQKLYTDELRDLYNAETQLLKALPKMAKGASSQELKDAFEKHLEQTKTHVERLEEVFEKLGEKPKGKTCRAMKGLIEEGSEILAKDGDESVLDAGIIVAAQKVEHYEIAGYGSVRTFAHLLGQNEAAELLQTTLDEESETNEILNKLAETVVNPEALMETELASSGSDR